MKRKSLESNISYIRKTDFPGLIDDFTIEYKRTMSEDLDIFIKEYLAYFLARKDYKRYIFHKCFDWAVWKKSVARQFYEPAEPAVYPSKDGKPPSYFNAIADLKKNIDRISKMKFDDQRSSEVLNWIVSYRLTGNKLLFFRQMDPMEESYFDREYIIPWAKKNPNPVCIDMGGFTGDTALEMNQKFRCPHIYSFEADRRNFRYMKRNCAAHSNILCIHKGCGKSKQIVSVSGSGDSVYVDYEKHHTGQEIEICALDDEIQEKIDYMKLDIEGCELDALMGSREHIVRDKPVIAVCVYHKLEDFHEIYDYLHDLTDGYKFILRHYGAGRTETVLYAIYDK